MSNTRVIHFHDWDRTDPNAVWIGRANGWLHVKASPWGNPFRIGDPHPVTGVPMGRDEAIEAYRHGVREGTSPEWRYIREHAHELHGKTLVCACKDKKHPNQPCHGDPLKELADERL